MSTQFLVPPPLEKLELPFAVTRFEGGQGGFDYPFLASLGDEGKGSADKDVLICCTTILQSLYY